MDRSDYNARDSMKNFALGTYIDIIKSFQGDFQGEVQWCNNSAKNEWKRTNLYIDLDGALIYESQDVLSKTTKTDPQTVFNSSESESHIIKYEIIKHLQGCSLQLIKSDYKIPVIYLEAKGNVIKESVYLKVLSYEKFEELFASLTWWSNMKTNGIFNKLSFTKYESNLSKKDFEKFNKKENVLVCQFNCYGPVPSNININVLENMPKIDFIQRHQNKSSSIKWSWFSTMGVLKSNGVIDLLSQIDGSLIYSLSICNLLRSEIQIVDTSLLNSDSFLRLGLLKSLRQRMSISDKISLFRGNSELMSINQDIILGFPLRIDLEDWFLALKSFSVAEQLSLNGIDSSNKLKVFNLFKIDILEANLESISLGSGDSKFGLHIDIILWDQIVARTPLIFNNYTPFWREEFTLEEHVRIEAISIRLVQTIFEGNKPVSKIIGYMNINQTMLFDKSLENETRLPLYSYENDNFQLGTLCLKLKYNLQFLLPANNFKKLEDQLTSIPIALIVDEIYRAIETPNSPYNLNHISLTCLNVFQSLGRDIEWFKGLIIKEVNNIDDIMLKNSNSNSTNVHIYNSLFRGNSLFTVSIEKYFYRIGSEYLNKSIGKILQDIINDHESCEIDPNRITFLTNEEKETILLENRTRLLMWTRKIWNAIANTSNDLPSELKDVLKIVRTSLEKIFIDDNNNAILHCISGILFLRFFCPVILNPKLFNLTEHHLTDNSRRTLTLIAKILMNLTTLTFFGIKEMWMVEVNDFIKFYKDELLNYIERVTQKKLDFTPKVLKLTNNMSRPTIILNNSVLRDLPSLPYLIDKSLNETELIKILNVLDYFKKDYLNYQENKMLKNMHNENDHEKAEIGELEFEDITKNNAETFDEDFLKILKIKDNNEENNLTSSTSNKKMFVTDTRSKKLLLEQLARESNLLQYKMNYLISIHSGYEYPTDVMLNSKDYAKRLAKSIFIQQDNRIIIDQDKMVAKEGLRHMFASRTKSFNYSEFTENRLNDKNSISSVSIISSSSVESEENRKSFNGDISLLPKRRLESLRTRKLPSVMRSESTSEENLNKPKIERNGSRLTRFFNKIKNND